MNNNEFQGRRQGLGIGKYDRIPIYHLPQPIVAQPEVFSEITEQVVPNVRNYYMISTYGRLFHKFRNEYLAVSVDSKGYIYKPLTLKDASTKNERLHRLVLMTFAPIQGCENMLINHIDGNKCNNAIWNLEWCTYSENARHAIDSGLNNYDHISEAKVREVCELLENQDISLKQISNQTGVSYPIVQSINTKNSHVNISSEYNIQPRKVALNFSNKQVHDLCQWFSNNPKTMNETLDIYCTKAIIGTGVTDNPEYNLVRTTKKILARETYKFISQYYDF